MVFSGVLHGVNPGLSPIVVVVEQSGTLVLNRPNWVTEPGLTLELPQSPAGRGLEVFNSTAEAVLVNADSGATISGVTSSGAVFTDQPAVRIPPGQRAVFIRDQWVWRSQGAERNVLTFAYNGTPLANNPSNPAGASDLIHYLGGVSSFVNPATSGVVTVAVSSKFSAAGAGAVATDRIASPTLASENWYPNNQANSFIAWEFPRLFAPSGFLLQTSGVSGNPLHLRSFELRYSNDLSIALTPSSPVSSWIQGTVFNNQTQINTLGAWYFFNAPELPFARRWAILVTGPDSGGNNYATIAEVCWLGDFQV